MSSISISGKINSLINSTSPGIIFTYSDFNISKEKEVALAKSLSRLSKSGTIVRLSKGKYYKPRKTTFGNLKPDENQIILSLTQNRNKTVGYVTGLNVFNKLGLTTQMSNTIVIAKNNMQQSKEVNGIKVRFIKRDFDFTNIDTSLLQLLDAIKDIKTIPDADINESVKVIVANLKKLTQTKLRELVKLSMDYPPAVRALLGAIIDDFFREISSKSLYQSLNPLSKYKLKVSESILPAKSKWYIQ